MMNPFDGPANSPLNPTTSDTSVNSPSCGQLVTGIAMGVGNGMFFSVNDNAGYEGYRPGVTKPDFTAMAAADPGTGAPWGSALVAIGGGRSNVSSPASGGVVTTAPYGTGFGLCAWGNGASRDAGAGPTFQGFSLQYSAIQTANVANGATFAGAIAVVNRTGILFEASAAAPKRSSGSMTTANGATA